MRAFLTGQYGAFLEPFSHGGRNVIEVCSHHLHTAPEPPSARLGRAVPADVEKLLLDLLAKDPDERPRSANEVQQRVRECRAYGAWDHERARRWWQEHGEKLRRHRTEGPTLTRIEPALSVSKLVSGGP